MAAAACTVKPAEPSDMARQVRDLRHKRGMTQADLSRLTGVAKSDISRFESGRSAPTTRTVDRIVAALRARIVLLPSDDGAVPDVALQRAAHSEGRDERELPTVVRVARKRDGIA